ncbi:ATP-grasp domain-containing protein [Pseudolysinimonas yzui]|uniref:ATP-grasp domain-containing protein n=1 Tax=Pseudolysinimonas yzui TaxID=2708254 RepID=A0A8J3M1N7_9MICO|nr:ATP-grasp domain-containing protein [Pseudolysinimonas yzui]GHF14712.1 hypothetical protein GCM10011600_14570 [Pseudolysinimonas yzui]
MERDALKTAVESRLGARQLLWVGLRGDDAEPLSDLEQFAGSFSLIGRYVRRRDVVSESYEQFSGARVDPETWDIDDHLNDEPVVAFRHALLRALSRESAILPYRPSALLSAISFSQRERVACLGLFPSLQSAFEHKPWVESSIAALGDVPYVPWTYIADEDQMLARSFFGDGTVVLRRSRTSGGEGIVHVRDPDDVRSNWPRGADAFASISRFIDDAIPVNVGATVWRDGVTVHHASVQLIGIPGLVSREFGYCGNDFARAKDLGAEVLDQIEESTTRIGDWLRSYGFRGSFGVDFLVADGRPLFLEVNPRFQGSTHASARLDIEQGLPDLMLEHLAAWLDLDRPAAPPLRDRVAAASDFSHVVFHRIADEPDVLDITPLVRSIRELPGRNGTELVLPSEIECAPGAAMLRWTTWQTVTRSGYELLDPFNHLSAVLGAERQEHP